MQSSLVFVKQVNIAPLCLIYLTTSASWGARISLRNFEPVALGIPSTQKHSLQENGTPKRGAFSGEYFSCKIFPLKILSTFRASFIDMSINNTKFFRIKNSFYPHYLERFFEASLYNTIYQRLYFIYSIYVNIHQF